MPILRDADPLWIKQVFIVDYTKFPTIDSYAAAIHFAMRADFEKGDVKESKPSAGWMDLFLTGDLAKLVLPETFFKQQYVDSSIGGNDAFNPHFQFGPDDDIATDMYTRTGEKSGMGRVYSEMYNANQQILWMRFGCPHFAGATNFYLAKSDPTVPNYMNNGFITGGMKLVGVITKVATVAVMIQCLPLLYAKLAKDAATAILKGVPTNSDSPSKYYYLRPAMPQYYRMVNTILQELAVGMGLYDQWEVLAAVETGGINERGGVDKLYKDSGVPEILKRGPDIYAIMDKRRAFMNGTDPYNEQAAMEEHAQHDTDTESGPDNQTAEGTEKPDAKGDGWWAKFLRGFTSQMGGSGDFVGFRIDKNVDNSESVSNSTGESELAGTLNNFAASQRNKIFGLAGLKTGIAIADAVVDTAKAAVSEVASLVHMGGVVELMAGNGFYDVPETWKSSSYSKSYSFNIQLRSLYGDPVSIYQSIYVPLALLIAASFPRGVGRNQFTSPLLVEAYCKGMFAVPLGMVESITIKRGMNEYGWTHENLPTAVDVTLNIKDLSPVVYLAINDKEMAFREIFMQNDGLHSYLTTLSGIGLRERLNYKNLIQRKATMWWKMKQRTWFNPFYWGNKFGNGAIPKAIGILAPIPGLNRTPGN